MIKISSNLERMLATKVAEGLGFNENLARDAGVGALGGAGLGALIQAIRGKSVLKGLGLGALGGGLGGTGYNYLSGPSVNPFENPSAVDSRPPEHQAIMPEAAYDTGPFLLDARAFPAVQEHGRSIGMENALDASDRIDRENAITFDDIRAIVGAESVPHLSDAPPASVYGTTSIPPLNLYRP
jgi:hypothetical protein